MLIRVLHDTSGQGTIEAAVVIPILFLLMLLLLQPGIVLYDRIVMSNAEAFVRHRLAAVPQHDCFHVHGGDCSWRIELTGDENSGSVSVSISNELRPLPLFDAGMKLLGIANGSGNLEITESSTMQTQPGWVSSSPAGTTPKDWVGAWLS